MAYDFPDNDSTFGEDISSWIDDSMFDLQPAPLAGSKRDVDNVITSAQTTTSALAAPWEHQAEHIDPRALTQSTWATELPSRKPTTDARPSKRRASTAKVAGHRGANGVNSHKTPIVDHHSTDLCYEPECRGFSPCASPCAQSPCSAPCEDQCTGEDVCRDPHCDQVQPCADGCIDPECTKIDCPDETCFCTTCEAQPCPFGPPGNECHVAHTAPDVSGTIYCYDNVPCHFQDDYNFTHESLPAYDGLCFSPSHDALTQCSFPSHQPTSVAHAWSPSNYTSVESTFSAQPSPAPGTSYSTPCSFGDAQGDHCHIDRSACCHGSKRSHGEFNLDLLDSWKPSIGTAEQHSSTSGFMSLGYGSQTTQPASSLSFDLPTSGTFDSNLDFTLTDPMLGFEHGSWMMQPPQLPILDGNPSNKLDFLVSPLPKDIQIKSEPFVPDHNFDLSNIRSATSQSAEPSTLCICRWQHSPSHICLETFDSPETLHKHIKASHVDSCARCQCQWEGCDAHDKDFKQRSKLSRHLLGHAGYRPYACSFQGCGKTFATNQAKDNHERTHTGDRPYVCKECGYTTTTHTQLQTHISALHMNQKPHKCRYCDFKCADSSNLSKHERTHQTLRPYRCPQPGCTFKPDCRWENLKRHLRRSNHCPALLIDGSEENKAYRETVKRETDEWNRRHEASGGVGGGGLLMAGVGGRRGRGRSRES